MVAVIGRPSERKLRHIARSDDHAIRLISDIHEYLCAFPRLSVFISNVMVITFLPDIPEMNRHRFFNIDFL